ncbi:MAG TPA: hypothetical protein VHC90_07040 [Bryobacteraceae bacterium]|nr:hypothetical protein [Bryobacteraceae bacterium]
MGDIVELVLRVDQSNQNTHIEQGHFHSSSSRSLLINSVVTSGAAGRLGKSGTPLRYSRACDFGSNESPSSLEITSPALLLSRAISLIVSGTLSSISSTVRMRGVYGI